MDSLITAAARALASGDPLGALKRVALRDDAPALALRGTAMAQLGDFARARALLRKAARAFGSKEAAARARCVVAEAEIALASRDLGATGKTLDAARLTLEEHGDTANAALARLIEVRRLLLMGRLDEAEHALGELDSVPLLAAQRAVQALLVAGIALRRIHAQAARDALARAHQAAARARIPALSAEVESALLELEQPAARLVTGGAERLLRLEEVEKVLASRAFIVDACRHMVRTGRARISLARRPVLFAIARVLAEAWPGDVSREALVKRTFGLQAADESLRARLRVEVGRLRNALGSVARVSATRNGYALEPLPARDVVLLLRPVEGKHSAVLSLLADGETWSSSALALALGASQRTVQRALETLAGTGKVARLGRGRARRWTISPGPGFTTTLLLPGSLPPR